MDTNDKEFDDGGIHEIVGLTLKRIRFRPTVRNIGKFSCHIIENTILNKRIALRKVIIGCLTLQIWTL